MNNYETPLQKMMNSNKFYLFGVEFNIDLENYRYKSWSANKIYNFEDVEFPFKINIVNNTTHNLIEFKFVFSNLGNYITLSKEVINDFVDDYEYITKDIEKNIMVEFKNKIKDSVFTSMVKNQEIEPIYELSKGLSKYTGVKVDEIMEFLYKSESFQRKFMNL